MSGVSAQPDFSSIALCDAWSLAGSVHSVWETLLGILPMPDMVRSKVQLPALKLGQSAARAIGDKFAISAAIASRRSGLAVDLEIVVTVFASGL